MKFQSGSLCKRDILALSLIILSLSAGRATAFEQLDELVSNVLSWNPTVQAARHEMEQALARYEQEFGFFDPLLFATAGTAERPRNFVSFGSVSARGSNSTGIEAGVFKPLQPGLYLTAGITEQYLAQPPGVNGGLYQSLLGASVRIPLLRDRGFRQWNLAQVRAYAEYSHASNQLLTVQQALRHAVELRLLAVYEALAAVEVARDATARYSALKNEARDLVDLKVIPEYQIRPARLQLLLRQEEELRSHATYEIAVEQLRELAGEHIPDSFAEARQVLVDWAQQATLPERIDSMQALLHKGQYRQLLDDMEIARSRLSLAQDDMKADLSLLVSVSYQGEDRNQPFGTDRLLSDEHLGGEAALVWTRPLGYVNTRARIGEHEARLEQVRENLRELELALRADLRSAHIAAAAATERLMLVNAAVTDAEQTLTAEEERFRLGENRSRDLLDAQEDLTDVVVRQMRIAAEFIRLYSDFHFAAGYSFRQGFNKIFIPSTEEE